MIKIEGVKHEEFIQGLCDTYGKLKFDPDNSGLKNDYEGLKKIILERMNSYSIVDSMELSELLTLEDVVVNKYKINEVFDKLNKYLESQHYSPVNTSNHSNAVLIAMMDNSGSMGFFERYMGKAIAIWNKMLLESKYVKVELEYVAYSTEAKSVNETTFFEDSVSGGTIASSAYVRCLELINSKDYKNKDIYVIHITDGDNLTSDNRRTENYLYDILNKVAQFQYVETNQYNRSSTLMSCFRSVHHNKFIKSVIKDKNDVMNTILDAYKIIE
jgi:uncharacterized sporulation protein YeaH/YhbH (DUF444 family)